VRQDDGGVVRGNESEDGESKMNGSKGSAAKHERTEPRMGRNRRGMLSRLM
jgi:hypothetical protein